MACVSFYIYGHVGKKQSLRDRLMLFFANECFTNRFAAMNDVFVAYFSLSLNFDETCTEYYNKIRCESDAIKFFFRNSVRGKITCRKTMALVTERFYNIKIYLNKERIGEGSENAIDSLHLEFDKKEKKFSLVCYSPMILKSKTAVAFDLRVSKNIGKDCEVVGRFNRKDNIHTYSLTADAISPQFIYTVFPVNSYKQTKSVFIFKRVGLTRKCVHVGSCLQEENDLNPYFHLESETKKSIEILIVESENFRDACNLLQIKRKLSVTM